MNYYNNHYVSMVRNTTKDLSDTSGARNYLGVGGV